MLYKRSISGIFLSAFIVAAAATISFAQTQKSVPGETAPENKPHNVQSEPDKAFKRWIDEDVKYIITAEEARAFRALKTNEERENFIDVFWHNRDPDPDTEENEYRDAYYERIAYANENFSSGVAGWRTDRGRIYIRWGKPDSVESHPTGGGYDRPAYEGGGSTTVYPFETWFYRHLDGVGDGIEIEFVDPTNTGEYRIARDPKEKDALATVNGGASDRGEAGNAFVRQQDSVFNRMSIVKDLETAPRVKYTDLERMISSGSGAVIDNDPLRLDLRVDFFKQSEASVIAAFSIQTDNKDLKFSNTGDPRTATMNIFGKITAVSGKPAGTFEDAVTASVSPDGLLDLRDQKSIYQKVVALAPGTYRVDVAIRDVSTGKAGSSRLGFVVPRYDETKLSSSSLVLTSTLRPGRESDIGQLFVIRNTKVVPNIGSVYKQGQEVGVYMQIYNAEIDQTTLRPAVDVEYVLTKDGTEVLRQKEDWSGTSDSGRRLALARSFSSSALAAGEYEVRVEVRDRVGGQLIENKAKFTIMR